MNKHIFTVKYKLAEPFSIEISEMLECTSIEQAISLAQSKSKEKGWTLLGVYQSYLNTRQN